jgi:hypothetical protein
MVSFWKQRRQVDKDYLKLIREKPCCVCFGVAEPHHLVTRGAGGSDYHTVPLCREHHSELHRLGLLAFEGRYRLNLWRVAAFLLAEIKGERDGD